MLAACLFSPQAGQNFCTKIIRIFKKNFNVYPVTYWITVSKHGTQKIFIKKKKENLRRTSLVAQWLRAHATNAGSADLIPGQGNIAHMLWGVAKKNYRTCDFIDILVYTDPFNIVMLIIVLEL